jgi:hypothetical protein
VNEIEGELKILQESSNVKIANFKEKLSKCGEVNMTQFKNKMYNILLYVSISSSVTRIGAVESI